MKPKDRAKILWNDSNVISLVKVPTANDGKTELWPEYLVTLKPETGFKVAVRLKNPDALSFILKAGKIPTYLELGVKNESPKAIS